MSFSVKALIFLILGVSVIGQANAVPDHCPMDPNDPFSFEARMPGGPYKGRCINTNHYRSVRVLNEEERQTFGINDPSLLAVANFRHLDKFWVAVIQPDGIQDVVYQHMILNKALEAMSHGQLRYRLRPDAQPVILIEQKKEGRRSLVMRTADGKPQDFILSLFGVRDVAHDGKGFDPIYGINLFGVGRYAISYSMQSLYDGDQWVITQHQQADQHLLTLDQDQAIRSLEFGMNMSPDGGMPEIYDLLVNNCISFVYRVLKSVTNLPEQTLAARWLETHIPVNDLRLAGLVNDKPDPSIAPVPTIAKEFPHGVPKIQLPAAQ